MERRRATPGHPLDDWVIDAQGAGAERADPGRRKMSGLVMAGLITSGLVKVLHSSPNRCAMNVAVFGTAVQMSSGCSNGGVVDQIG